MAYNQGQNGEQTTDSRHHRRHITQQQAQQPRVRSMSSSPSSRALPRRDMFASCSTLQAIRAELHAADAHQRNNFAIFTTLREVNSVMRVTDK